jgi:hypothetical protein
MDQQELHDVPDNKLIDIHQKTKKTKTTKKRR